MLVEGGRRDASGGREEVCLWRGRGGMLIKGERRDGSGGREEGC